MPLNYRRDDIIDTIKRAYIAVNQKNCPIFGVSTKDLKPFTTTEGDMKKKYSRMTQPEHRMISEDLLKPQDGAQGAAESLGKMSVSDASTNETQNFEEDQDIRAQQRKANDNLAFEDDDDEDSKFNGDEMDQQIRQSMAGGGKNVYARGKVPAKLEDFKLRKLIGKGTFGKVFLVEHSVTGKLYAMKCIRKDIIIENEQMENIQLEKDILYTIDHPFLVNMEYVFQNDFRIYFLMHFVKGGELFRHLVTVKKFPED